MPDPDEGLEIRPEIEEQLRKSLETPAEDLLTSEQMWAKIEPHGIICLSCGCSMRVVFHPYPPAPPKHPTNEELLGHMLRQACMACGGRKGFRVMTEEDEVFYED